MFPLATPLGVKSHKTGVVMLNPADDYVLMAGGCTQAGTSGFNASHAL